MKPPPLPKETQQDSYNPDLLASSRWTPIAPPPVDSVDNPPPVRMNGSGGVLMIGYPSGSAMDIIHGPTDPSAMAGQMIQSGELFRLQRGFPYKRAGHMVPVFPQFKTQNLTLPNLASQPQANRSVAQIIQPTADTNTTNANTGTPFVGFPGFVKINLT